MDRKQHPMVIRPWNAGRPHAPYAGRTAGKNRTTQPRRKQAVKRSKP